MEANLIDSIAVPDSLNVGRIQTVLSGDELAKVAIPPGSGEPLAVGIGIGAAQPTGIRLGSAAGGTGPSFVTYVTVDVPDTATAIRKQQIARAAAGFNTFVVETPAVHGHDAAHRRRRSVLACVAPVRPAPGDRGFGHDRPGDAGADAQRPRSSGLPTDPALLTATAVLADLGAKSPITTDPTFIAGDTLTPGTSDVVSLDVTRLVQLWVSSPERPAVHLPHTCCRRPRRSCEPSSAPSRRPDIGVPRLIIDYQMPFPFERP